MILAVKNQKINSSVVYPITNDPSPKFNQNLLNSDNPIDTFSKSTCNPQSKISFAQKAPSIDELRTELVELGEKVNYSDSIKQLQKKINSAREKLSASLDETSEVDPVKSFWDMIVRI